TSTSATIWTVTFPSCASTVTRSSTPGNRWRCPVSLRRCGVARASRKPCFEPTSGALRLPETICCLRGKLAWGLAYPGLHTLRYRHVARFRTRTEDLGCTNQIERLLP